MTSNIHNVLHIIEDVRRFGDLPSMSAYPFESYLGKMKSIIRAGHHPLKQIARRMAERSSIQSTVSARVSATVEDTVRA